MDRFRQPFQSLREIYEPLHFLRVGLRYRDFIHRDKLGLTDVPWSELLKPPIASELASPEISGHVKHAAHSVVIYNPDKKMQVFLQHGLVMPGNPEYKDAYYIDSDFSVQNETRAEDVQAMLDSFNREGRRLFRWCITERLHMALEPEPAGVG